MGNLLSRRRVKETRDPESPMVKHILNTLDKLKAREFENFKVHLGHPDVLEGQGRIPQSFLGDRRSIARMIVWSYPSHAICHIVVNALKKIHRNDLLDRFLDLSKVAVVTPDQHEATDADPPCSSSTSTCRGAEAPKHYVDQHRRFLISHVKKVDPILDLLLEKDVITEGNYDFVRSKTTSQDKMRELYTFLKCRTAKDLFYEGLEEHENCLLDHLRSNKADVNMGNLLSRRRVKETRDPESPMVKHILNTLDKLKAREFENFKVHLGHPDVLEGQGRIPQSFLGDRRSIARMIVWSYPSHAICHIVVNALKKIHRNDLLDRFLDLSKVVVAVVTPDQHEATDADPPSSSSTSTCRGAEVHAINEAHDGGVVVAPVLKQCNIGGSVNITVNTTQQASTGEEKAREDKAKLRGLWEKMTDYEDELQHNMYDTYLSVKLGTKPEIMFENVFIPLYNADINVTDIHSHHEVRQMEMKKAGEGKEIQLSEMFKDPSGRNKRTVLTVGCAGIGKTFLTHKFLFDWANKRFPQDPHLVFPFKFRQLNLLKGQNFSLAKLIHHCIKETRIIEEDILNEILTRLQKSVDYNRSPFKVMFVMDGYDEKNVHLDFQTNFGFMNATDSYPVEVLLVSLIKGDLLPSAHIWITSRPAAANQIPEHFINRMTEVRGFIRDDQKKEFFMKTFNDENQACSIYSHIKESKILHTMCELPVFCWMFGKVVHNVEMTGKLPKTLVGTYCHFLMSETLREKMKNPALDKADKEKLIKDAREFLLKLGKLALDQLDEGKIIFYQEDLEACGLDVNKDLQNLGFCTKFFKEDDVFFLQTVYCFVHLSIQEFLAAVYLFHCFTQRNMEVLKTFLEDDDYNSDTSLSDFLKAAMKKSLQSESGHLDLFIRFLHGLSLESNQSLLGGLLGQTEKSPEEIQRAIDNLKKMVDDDFSPDRLINIFHCLMEMNDPSVSQGIQQYLESESRSGKKLSETQCSALATMLQMSEVLDVLDLDKYNTDRRGRQRLVPAVRNCTTARLVGCQLQKEHIEVVASALRSNPSHLRHLDLSSNNLDLDLLVLLCDALKSPHCKLETLRLIHCWLSERSCELLASAISSNPSHLRELDLNFNVLPGLKNFSGLETLNVKHGGELWTNPQLLTRYLHRLTLDPNTASRKLCLSEDNRKVTLTPGAELQPYPDHPDRFGDGDRQVLCSEGLTGRCYCEVETSGGFGIGVTYRGISRRGEGSELGLNDQSWCLRCAGGIYSVYHNSRRTDLPVRSSGSNRVAVYLDHPAGTVSFYDVSSDSLTHLYTFHSTFTEPLYPGFRLYWSSSYSSSVRLCEDR